ncbi:MAG: response regulator [Alphaproteobacteria bacterium]|nr:response regulator [Alphaproteobacteria bacterium]
MIRKSRIRGLIMAIQEDCALRAMIVDHNRLYRAGLKLTLESANVRVVAEGDDLKALMAGSDEAGGDILLLKLPRAAAVAEALGNARQAFPAAKLVVIADANLNSDAMVTAIQAGADGVLLSELSPDVFLQSLRLVRLGEKVLPAQLARMLIGGDARVSHMPSQMRQLGLSAREMEILRLLVDGSSNKGIARRLDIAEATVKVHVKAVLRKIQVTNRTQAAVWALNHGVACEQEA